MMDSRQRGFTLIEILVTLVVIAIGVSLVGLNVTGANRQLQHEAAVESFYQRLQLAQEESVLMNRQMGVSLQVEAGSRGARVQWLSLRLKDNGLWAWQPASGEVFQNSLEDAFSVVELDVDGLAVDLLEVREPRNPEIFNGSTPSLAAGVLPQIFIFASGEVTPFVLKIAAEEGQDELDTHRIEGNILGQLRWLKPGDDGSGFND